MFSYFEDGITDTKCKKTIDIIELVEIIKDNPQKQKIDWIRKLRKRDCNEYKILKKQLPNITPNCMVKIRGLEHELFEKHFISSSGYIYIDLDVDISQTIEYKNYFIKKYGHLVSLVCLSSSHGGISVFFKLENQINNKETFQLYWDYIKTQILQGEPVDDNSKGIGRAMFISCDPQVYYNPDNSITIDIKKCSTQGISTNNTINISTSKNIINYRISIIPYEQVLDKIITSTSIENINPIVDYFPIEYTKSRFPNKIKDGDKHKIYSVMIHRLVYLNKHLPIGYIYSYLYYVNKKNAEPPMEPREFHRLFWHTYGITQQEKYKFQHERIKWFHFNPNSNLTGDEKRDIASKLNGMKKINDSIKKIQQAKDELSFQGKKISKLAVARISKLSRNTVIEHFDSELIDIEREVQILNDSIEVSMNKNDSLSTSIPGIESGQLSSEWKNDNLLEDEIHPECPRWVQNWYQRNAWKSTG